MIYSEGKLGRVFVIRLSEEDVLPDCIERFAGEHGISVGQAVLVGGIMGGDIVVGPRGNNEMPPDPMILPIDGVQEVVGIGVLAPDKNGRSSFHIHAALGRSGQTVTGCLRMGVDVWKVAEVVLYEILGADVARLPDTETGFDLLMPRLDASEK
ncbi:MAG: DNA-binding protein [Dehalococcoidia bacterium]|nr:DNA-binding protein [Dehalococcoidia bacterium]